MDTKTPSHAEPEQERPAERPGSPGSDAPGQPLSGTGSVPGSEAPYGVAPSSGHQPAGSAADRATEPEAGPAGEPGPAATDAKHPASPLETKVVEALRTCYDPEIPVDIYELGLIYSIEVRPAGEVAVRMTLTSPACPVAGSLPPEVEAKIRGIAGVSSATVDVVWDPPWNPTMMSEAAKLRLNMM